MKQPIIAIFCQAIMFILPFHNHQAVLELGSDLFGAMFRVWTRPDLVMSRRCHLEIIIKFNKLVIPRCCYLAIVKNKF